MMMQSHEPQVQAPQAQAPQAQATLSPGTMLRLGMTTVSAPLETGEDSGLSLLGEHVLVVDDGSAITPILVQQLWAAGMRPLVLEIGEFPVADPLALSSIAPIIRCHTWDPLAVEVQVARLRSVTRGLSGVFFLSTAIIPFQDQWFALASQRLKVAIAIVRGAHLVQELRLKFVYFVTAQGGRFGLESGVVDALAPGLEALAHPLRLEFTQTSFRTIDLDPSSSTADQVTSLLQELSQPDQPYRTAYGWHQGMRATLSIQSLDLSREGNAGLSPSSVVIFAGGARGIGAICAKSLASQVGCHMIFLGRTPLTDEIWELSRLSSAELHQRSDQFIQEFKAANPGCPPRAPRAAWKQKTQALEAIATLQTIQSLGAKAEYFALDVRNRDGVNGLFLQIQQRYGNIDAVVHVAGLGGVDTDRMLLRKDWPTIEQVLETKVIGALHLLEAARTVGVPIFLGFGSIASRFGNTGQVDYAAANGLLNGIARAHNASGQIPRVRVLSWGAWDGVGMAVSGPTKEMLLTYGLKFIHPDVGAAYFLQELTAPLNPSLPAEVYLSPEWDGLTKLLQDQDTPPLPAVACQTLLGVIVEHLTQERLKAEQTLHPKDICFLDHHRYDGTAWVPAAMGMEVAVEAALTLFPGQHPIGLRDFVLKKAVRLVRDQPVLLQTHAEFVQVYGDTTHVQVILSAQFQERTWVFAEVQVLLRATPNIALPTIPPPANLRHEQNEASNTGKILRTRSQLYPSEWLRFHTQGETFQVLDELRQDCASGYAQGQISNKTDLSAYSTPLTWVDGCFQAYAEFYSNSLGHWSGPPLRIGEIRWLPALFETSSAVVQVQLQVNHCTASRVQLQDAQGRCLLSLSQLEFGGTGVPSKEHANVNALTPVTPYLGEVIEKIPGERLVAEQILDPETEVMLRDHRFPFLNGSFIFVPAVYFMEVAVEAAVCLTPGQPPVEVQNFHVHRALHFIQEPQRLITEAEVVAPGKTHVRMLSRRGEKTTLHSEAWVVQGSFTALIPLAVPPLGANPQIRTKAGLYPHRFPNGPIFQVIDQMRLGEHHLSLTRLKMTGSPRPGCWLPVTLLDGAFQVDSATRSGFDKHSGLPKSVASLRWIPEVLETDHLDCFSSTGSDETHKPGDLFFMDDPNNTVLLQMAGIRLTPVLPQRGAR